MAVTIKDIAREAGVSIATVSKVINHIPSISQGTAIKVRDVMERLNYAPNSHAAGLARKNTRNIAFLANLRQGEAFENPHMFEILCGAQNTLSAKGYSLSLVDVSGDKEQGASAQKVILQKEADGVIIHGAAISKPVASLLIKRAFPHIVIGHSGFDTRLCWIDSNHILAGQLATEHLLERGYKQVAFLAGQEGEDISRMRLQGFCRALREYGLDWENAPIGYTGGDYAGSVAAAAQLIKERKPEAVVCASNLIAAGVYKAAGELEVKIPKELAVITFDRYPYSNALLPVPSLVHINVYDMGCEAAKLLLRMMKNPALQVQSFLTLPEVIPNETT